jgi:hypothetical protein
MLKIRRESKVHRLVFATKRNIFVIMATLHEPRITKEEWNVQRQRVHFLRAPYCYH